MGDVINLRAARRRREMGAAGWLPAEDLTFRTEPDHEGVVVVLHVDTDSFEQEIRLPPETARQLSRALFAGAVAVEKGGR